MMILGQKSYFLGHNIFKIPQANWYCCLLTPGLGLKKPWIKLGVENSGFEMSFNPIKVFDYLNRTNCPTDKSMDERPPEEK